jgi:hypothetical protein
MNERRKQLIKFLASQVDDWTKEDLVMFAYDRRWDELSEMTDAELEQEYQDYLPWCADD